MSVHDFRWMEREHTSEYEAGRNAERGALVNFLRLNFPRSAWMPAVIKRLEAGEHRSPSAHKGAQEDCELVALITRALQDDGDDGQPEDWYSTES